MSAGGHATRWSWRLTILSALLYVLAFNLTFFIQELFLVLPKAFTPGLRPTLFHNDHHWEGQNALASLFQGTGALATFLIGSTCALLLRRGAGKSAGMRLFLFWMAYSGIFMALPQVAIGAISDQSDLGMAMMYFGLGPAARTAAALIALAAIPPIAIRLGRLLLAQIGGADHAASARSRNLFVFQAATLPALLALPLIVLFRIPREWIEVLLVPVVVTVIGLTWMQASAWRAGGNVSNGAPAAGSLAWPLTAVVCLLLIFQIVLRPGIHFYLGSQEYKQQYRQKLDLMEKEEQVVEMAPWFGKTGLSDTTERELPRYLRREYGQSLFDAGSLKAADLRYLGRFPDGTGAIYFWRMGDGSKAPFAYITVSASGDEVLGWGNKRPPAP